MDGNEFIKSIITYKISLSWIDIKIIKFVKSVKKFVFIIFAYMYTLSQG